MQLNEIIHTHKQLSQKMATMTKIDMDKKTESSQLNNGKGLFIYWQPSL